MGQLLGCVGILGMELHVGDEGLEGAWTIPRTSDIDVSRLSEANC